MELNTHFAATVMAVSNTGVSPMIQNSSMHFTLPALLHAFLHPYLFHYTVKTYGLLQPYFGHLSCMPVVNVTCCKTSKDASNQNQSLSVVEKLLLSLN